jgi:hypothetical protein
MCQKRAQEKRQKAQMVRASSRRIGPVVVWLFCKLILVVQRNVVSTFVSWL